jgi:hypothetical protein
MLGELLFKAIILLLRNTHGLLYLLKVLQQLVIFCLQLLYS